MADYRRHFEEGPRRSAQSPRAGDPGHERDWSDRAIDEVRSYERGEYGSREDRASRWESFHPGPRDDRDYYAGAATGSYRTDDRPYHDRYRAERPREDYRDRDEARYEAQSPGAEFEDDRYNGGLPAWARRERGGYWRQYEVPRSPYAGRGPKDYQRSDDRVREEICDCMTDDPMLDASEITVAGQQGRGDAQRHGDEPRAEAPRRGCRRAD